MRREMKTSDQKFLRTKDGGWRAEIDVFLADDPAIPPSIKLCRHAVLTVQTLDNHDNPCIVYVVYDRLLSRIVNGVFSGENLEGALQVAQSYNRDPEAPQDMAPSGYALGLVYPMQLKQEQEDAGWIS